MSQFERLIRPVAIPESAHRYIKSYLGNGYTKGLTRRGWDLDVKYADAKVEALLRELDLYAPHPSAPYDNRRRQTTR